MNLEKFGWFLIRGSQISEVTGWPAYIRGSIPSHLCCMRSALMSPGGSGMRINNHLGVPAQSSRSSGWFQVLPASLSWIP